MSAALHTSGPRSWQASPAHGYRIRTADSTSSLKFGSGDVGVVFFAGNGRSTEQCKADARLIAAAPTLLKTLSDMDSWLANTGHDENHPWRVSIRVAIAKATGSAS